MKKILDDPVDVALLCQIPRPYAQQVIERLAAAGYRITRRPGRPVHRDAESGQFVSEGEARRHPEETVRET